jgi:hypothetical protein
MEKIHFLAFLDPALLETYTPQPVLPVIYHHWKELHGGLFYLPDCL